jgi:hypothetical protein
MGSLLVPSDRRKLSVTRNNPASWPLAHPRRSLAVFATIAGPVGLAYVPTPKMRANRSREYILIRAAAIYDI